MEISSLIALCPLTHRLLTKAFRILRKQAMKYLITDKTFMKSSTLNSSIVQVWRHLEYAAAFWYFSWQGTSGIHCNKKQESESKSNVFEYSPNIGAFFCMKVWHWQVGQCPGHRGGFSSNSSAKFENQNLSPVSELRLMNHQYLDRLQKCTQKWTCTITNQRTL